MINLTSGKTDLSSSEMPGPGKRSVPPLKSMKRQTKNLNLNSKNPLLPTWDTSSTMPEPPQEGDFEIGLGLESELTKEWADLLTNTPIRSPSPPLFLDYVEKESMDYTEKASVDEVWGCLVSPMVVEGRQTTEMVVEEPVTSDHNYTAESEVVIPEFTVSDLDDLDAFLTSGPVLPASTTTTDADSADPLSVPEGSTFDIVQFAMGESGLDLDQMKPVNNVSIEIIEEEREDVVSEHKKIKLEPDLDLVQIEPNNNISNGSIVVKKRKKAGRPVNQEPIIVTEIPVESKLSNQELTALKYRRTRDLNNQASRRFRQKKKQEDDKNQQELLDVQARNMELNMQKKQLEEEVAMWKARVASLDN